MKSTAAREHSSKRAQQLSPEVGVASEAWQDTLKEIYAIPVRVHDDQAISMKCVYVWLSHFREGLENVSDKTRSGRSSISVSDEEDELQINR
ncbi:hypothetical protein TNCV_4787711 [Trichonephila clavipes]|nr:hypothetical protein TNCV_4787711 [Trichonephila clavipes]